MEPQNLMALGDGENDVEMLQVCFTVLAYFLQAVCIPLVNCTAEAVQITQSCKRSEHKIWAVRKE